MIQDRFAHLGFAARRRPSGLLASIAWLGGMIAALAAVTVGAVLAVFTAAAVAVIALVAGMLVFFAGLAVRARRTARARTAAADGLIEAHKIGDTWVTYGWERQNR